MYRILAIVVIVLAGSDAVFAASGIPPGPLNAYIQQREANERADRENAEAAMRILREQENIRLMRLQQDSLRLQILQQQEQQRQMVLQQQAMQEQQRLLDIQKQQLLEQQAQQEKASKRQDPKQ
jgi:hypothetical protein